MEYYWTSIHYYEAGRTDWTRSEKKKKKRKRKGKQRHCWAKSELRKRLADGRLAGGWTRGVIGCDAGFLGNVISTRLLFDTRTHVCVCVCGLCFVYCWDFLVGTGVM